MRRSLIIVPAIVALALTGCGGATHATSSTSAKAGAVAKKHHHHHHRRRAGAPAPLTGSYRGPVPILMYHLVTAPKPGETYPELWTPQKTFAATMAALHRAGYGGVTLDAVWKAWHGGPGLPRHPVVMSFDDGYLSQYQRARPILRTLGWPGVLNIEGKNIDPQVGLSKHQIRTMIADGWEVDSHTLTHPDLTTVDDAQLKTELVNSKRKIHRIFGVPVDFFCYPAGKNDARVQAAVKAAGYLAATTVDPGVASKRDNPFALPRIRINGSDEPPAILKRIRSLGAGA